MKKFVNRKKVAKKIRSKIRNGNEFVVRLTVHKSVKNTYAQLIQEKNGSDVTLASVSTLGADFKKAANSEYGSNVEAAKLIGKIIAEKGKKLGISTVSFDRSGFKYHGRVKAIAEAARESGLVF